MISEMLHIKQQNNGLNLKNYTTPFSPLYSNII